MILDQIIQLEQLPDGDWQAPTPAEGWRRPFGGHLLAQTLAAAERSVPSGKVIHNMQTQFIRSGRSGLPIRYRCEALHDGSRFAIRRVVAMQEDRVLTESLASFQLPEAGLDHQPDLPQVPAPDLLPSEQRLRHEAAALEGVEWCLSPLLPVLPVEMRPVQERDFVAPARQPGRLDLWMRADQPVAPANGNAFAACISDILLLSVALLPHGISWCTTPVEGSTLNHSLWFHRPVPTDGWLLWSLEVEWTGATRGLAKGTLWTADGLLLATAMQEGLIRLRGPEGRTTTLPAELGKSADVQSY